jgi:hypothetical protein
MYCPILRDNSDSGVTCTIFSRYHESLYSMRLPALRQTNFKLGPVPYRGNVVARVNCSERLQRYTNPFYIKPPTPSSFMSNFICPKTTLETFQWSRDYSKVFINIFEIFPESVPIQEFLAPLQVFQRL